MKIMSGDKVTNAIACGGVFSCLLPSIEVINGYLTLTLTVLSLAWLAYKFIKEWRDGDKK